MKKGFTVREKVLLVLLLVLVIGAAYYYVFFLPTSAQIDTYRQELIAAEDEIFNAQIMVAKMDKMQKELDKIATSEDTSVKPLPVYDNSRALLNELNAVLANTLEYNIQFVEAELYEEDKIVRRNLRINYTIFGYEEAKDILLKIKNSEFQNNILELNISREGENYKIYLSVTYYESLK